MFITEQLETFLYRSPGLIVAYIAGEHVVEERIGKCQWSHSVPAILIRYNIEIDTMHGLRPATTADTFVKGLAAYAFGRLFQYPGKVKVFRQLGRAVEIIAHQRLKCILAGKFNDADRAS